MIAKALGGWTLQLLGHDLGDVEQAWRVFFIFRERIAEHGVAEGTSGADGVRAGRDQLFGPRFIHPLAGLFSQEHEAASRSATEGALARARGINHRRRSRNHVARLVIDSAIAAQVTGIVKHHAGCHCVFAGS